MTPGIEAALVAAPLSLAGALVMRLIEARSRSNAWLREDRLRFLQEKKQAYADFTACCRWVVLNATERTSADWQRLEVSYQSVLLLAPASLVPIAQELLNHTLTVTNPAEKTATAVEEYARAMANFFNEARVDLGSDSKK